MNYWNGEQNETLTRREPSQASIDLRDYITLATPLAQLHLCISNEKRWWSALHASIETVSLV